MTTSRSVSRANALTALKACIIAFAPGGLVFLALYAVGILVYRKLRKRKAMRQEPPANS